MFEVLTPAERDRLTAKLATAALRFRNEYSELCATPLDLLADDYHLPPSGPAAWLGAASDAVFAAAEVSGATPGPSVYWSR
jgi:hypothetical protein